MKQSIIYALDFDGVICDSALETGISAWKAAAKIWDDFLTPLPPDYVSDQFRQIRPIMGTGYEAILIVRLLNNGETVDAIMQAYAYKTQQVMDASNLTVDGLKVLFGETRDEWIEQDLDQWIEMNPLFLNIAKKLQNLSEQGVWYIITTKQERFVAKILQANHVQLPPERIFGLDRKMTKEAVLVDLLNKHQGQQLYFVEDMLPTLSRIVNNKQLTAVKLFFALWGFNTEQDKADAKAYAVESIQLEQFL